MGFDSGTSRMQISSVTMEPSFSVQICWRMLGIIKFLLHFSLHSRQDFVSHSSFSYITKSTISTLFSTCTHKTLRKYVEETIFLHNFNHGLLNTIILHKFLHDQVQSHLYIRPGNRRLSLAALPGLPAASRGLKLPLLADSCSVFSHCNTGNFVNTPVHVDKNTPRR